LESHPLKAVLTRLTVIANAVIGRLDIDGQTYWTLEDAKELIPANSYHCIPHGWNNEPLHVLKVWEVANVNSRTGILFHAGNTDKDTLGCILVGMGVRQGALIESAGAILRMRQLIGANGFDLQIVERVAA
jgi:Family of unknown function (DUF5675)